MLTCSGEKKKYFLLSLIFVRVPNPSRENCTGFCNFLSFHLFFFLAAVAAILHLSQFRGSFQIYDGREERKDEVEHFLRLESNLKKGSWREERYHGESFKVAKEVDLARVEEFMLKRHFFHEWPSWLHWCSKASSPEKPESYKQMSSRKMLLGTTSQFRATYKKPTAMCSQWAKPLFSTKCISVLNIFFGSSNDACVEIVSSLPSILKRSFFSRPAPSSVSEFRHHKNSAARPSLGPQIIRLPGNVYWKNFLAAERYFFCGGGDPSSWM